MVCNNGMVRSTNLTGAEIIMRGIIHRPRLWRSLGAAALVGASLGLAACGGEGGESGETGKPAAHGEGGESGEAAAPPPPPPAAGGETGEAGAADAYAGLDGGARAAVRFQHLKGFLLVAQKTAEAGAVPEAGILVAQGALEVYDAAPGDLPGLTRSDLDAVEQLAQTTPAPKAFADATRKVEFKLDDLQRKGGGVDAELVRRMLSLTRGLYTEVFPEGGGVDPTEYQHSLGAALAAQDALTKAGIALKAKDPTRYAAAQAEMTKLIALWPSPIPPETPAAKSAVLAQVARVELALSGL